MDIRTKLALALVTVALASMLALGTFAYSVSAGLLQEISERQLDALAEAKKLEILGLFEGWQNDVRLIRSRTQLRKKLRALQVDGDPQALADIRQIIGDVLESANDVRRITLFDKAGTIVATQGEASSAAQLALNLVQDEVRYTGFIFTSQPQLIFDSLIELDDETIGGVQVVIASDNLHALASNYRGLGETGETLVFARTADDRFVLLHELRHAQATRAWNDSPKYVRAAASGVERLFTRGVRDYRNRPVWAATRHLSAPDWGLVVKVDAHEETARARALRDKLIDLGLALGAFAVVGGTLLGFYLARPIRALADVIQRVHDGETEVRANASSEDEIGLLAATLNNYLDEYGPDNPQSGDNDRPA